MIFLITIMFTCYLLFDPGIYLPLNFYKASRFVSTIRLTSL